MLSENGFFGLYRGVLSPVSGMAAICCVEYGTFFTAVHYTHKLRKIFSRNLDKKELTIPELAICGGLAGFASTFIITPMEYLRIIRQMNKFEGCYREIISHIYES